MKPTYLLLLIILFCAPAYAQENIVPLKNNAILNTLSKNALNSYQRISSISDTLSLPVIDDFSLDGSFPNQSIWCDSNVYINSDFPIDPPTVGVATFDGLNKFGNAYFTSSSGINGISDYLTSQPINLFEDDNMNVYLPSDSIFLSFFVQQKGLGEAPDAGDSLYIEFFNPSDSTWSWQWGLKGNFQTTFKKYKVSIVDTAYFKNGFQFRFVNYGNLTGNLDHWHLDYVILKRNLNLAVDTLIDDIGYVEKVKSLLKDYTAIPYSHYKSLAPNQGSVIVDSVSLRIRNNVNLLRLISNATDKIYNQFGSQIFSNVVSSNNINPDADSTYKFSLGAFTFPISQPGDSARFQLVNHIGVSAGDLVRDNDTIRFDQKFYDYYAYDDGTAEAGYFLSSAFAEMAVSFDLIKPDTLRGVYIHFTQINDNVSNERFTLKIWKSLGPGVGLVDSVVYQRTGFTPDYENVINGFHYYEFDSLIPVDGRIYVGFQQISSAHLNVGLDLNTNSNSNKFFNTQGTWNISQVQGEWMIRPVFGDTLLYAGIDNENQNSLEFNLFPNPANTHFYIDVPQKTSKGIFIEIYDVIGNLVLKSISLKNPVDVSFLNSGIYFVRLSQPDNGSFASRKLLISR